VNRLTLHVTRLLPAVCAALLGGCSLTPPKPWEKDVLARPEMMMDDAVLQRRYAEHIFTSKEGASGGSGVGGGGCGCG